MGREALLVADMINDFIDPEGSLYVGPTGREIIPFVKHKIDEARNKGKLVIFICDVHSPEDPEFKYFQRHAVKGTWGTEVIPELTVQPEDLRVDKPTYDSFFKTDLEEFLKKEQIERAEVVGVCTSICVYETAKGLFLRRIPAVVYRDGVADFDPEAHEFALKHLERVWGAEVV